MKKRLNILLSASLLCFTAAGQEEEKGPVASNHLMPSASFSALQIDSKDFVLSPSAGLQFMRIKNPKVQSHNPDLLMAGFSYSQNYFTQGLGAEQVKRIYGCSFMGNIMTGKNSFSAMVASNGEVPFSNIKTVSGALLYNRQLYKSQNLSFTLGAGLMVGDFGINIYGVDIYVFAMPVMSFSYTNNVLSTTISAMGLPAFKFTLFPKSMFRINTSAGIAGFKSVRDITFDCALAYYPLTSEKLKDALSISLGVMNRHSDFVLKDKTKYGYQYYCAYGEINASLLVLRCGYNFDGIRKVNDEITGEMPEGFFASLNATFVL